MSAAQNLPVEFPERLLAPMLNYQLAIDVVLGSEEELILEAYDLQHHELQAVKQSATFRQQVKRVQKQLEEDGGAFRIKAQAQAEEMLKEAFKLSTDSDMDPKVRADMIKSQVRWAGYDTPKQDVGGGNSGFTVHMHFGDSEPKSVNTYDHEG